MKNLIGYYYNLFVNEFKKKDSCFSFNIDGKNYEFIPFYGNVQNLYKNYLILKNNNKYCHEIILNKDNSILTFYKEIPYLLIKKNLCIDKYVEINEIINYDVIINDKYNLDWKNLWKQKIDYYEYQISQISFKYPILKNSFNYYIGLTECAISLLNYVKKSDVNCYICHRRITYKEKLCDFFNPTEIIIDSRTRDIAEFIKINYINNNMNIENVYKILENFNFNLSESILFLSRLIYPSYYFDLYDQIITEKISEEKIYSIIKKNTAYEVFLKKIYIYLKRVYAIPEIEWLNSIQY